MLSTPPAIISSASPHLIARAAVPTARYVYIEPDVHDDHRRSTTYVADHTGHIDPDDPRYAEITGRPVDPDDDIWVE